MTREEKLQTLSTLLSNLETLSLTHQIFYQRICSDMLFDFEHFEEIRKDLINTIQGEI